ncbi:MAG: hypothetical protein PHQ23_05480, partial [Candidatus Wallbacteria bacterium]|nr:hypothetical protein [Candidatus Wallbacteria bacterium]
ELIQVKSTQASLNINHSPVGEILVAKGFFGQKFSNKTIELSVVTNSDYSNNAKSLAALNGVKLLSRDFLIDKLSENHITMRTILKKENERLEKIEQLISC